MDETTSWREKRNRVLTCLTQGTVGSVRLEEKEAARTPQAPLYHVVSHRHRSAVPRLLCRKLKLSDEVSSCLQVGAAFSLLQEMLQMSKEEARTTCVVMEQVCRVSVISRLA